MPTTVVWCAQTSWRVQRVACLVSHAYSDAS